MSQATQFESINYAHVALGTKVITYGVQVLASIAVTALACACSSALVAALIAIIGAIIIAVFGEITALLVVAPVPPKHLATVGRASHSVAFKIGGLFARKQAVAA